MGKGQYNRRLSHLNENALDKDPNKLKTNVIRKILRDGKVPIIITVSDNLAEDAAFDIERKIILEIGRRDILTGPLVNMTNGGQGPSGKICSEETKEKLRRHFTGRPSPKSKYEKTENYHGATLGKKFTDEEKLKASERMKGFGNNRCKMTPEILLNIRQDILNDISDHDIGRRYNFTTVHIRNIRQGKVYPQ